MSSEWPMRPLGELTDNHDGKRRPVKEADRKPGGVDNGKYPEARAGRDIHGG